VNNISFHPILINNAIKPTVRCDRPSIKSYNKRGGGILIYIRQTYEIIELSHKFSHSENVQVSKISIHKKYMKPIIILSIYRAPETPVNFLKELENEIVQISDQELFIIGDLNIDQLNQNENHLRPIVNRYGLKQLIKEPTRVTDKTKSLIDVIITNSTFSDYKSSGILRCGLSDHDIIYTVRKIKKSFESTLVTREVRNFKKTDLNETRKMITCSPWWSLKLSKDNDRNFALFSEIIKIIMDTYAPKKRLRVKSQPLWMTKDYKNSLKVVDNLKYKAILNNTNQDRCEYRKMRNRCENFKKKLKMQSNMDYVNNSGNKTKTA
jgi:hypothetical protein